MWPHACFQLLISKRLAFSGMKTNRITLLRESVPLDYTVSFSGGYTKSSITKNPPQHSVERLQ